MMFKEHTIHLRVRYTEVDPMGYVHHSRYFQYFELARVELLRATGLSYAELDGQGVFFAGFKAPCQFKSPARYDEELAIITRIVRQTHVRIDHEYEVKRGETLLATASTTIACVGRDGKLRQIPP